MDGTSFGKSELQFLHLDEEFELLIPSRFNQNYSRNVSWKTEIDLREVNLLYIQLMKDIFCNKAIVQNTDDRRA